MNKQESTIRTITKDTAIANKATLRWDGEIIAEYTEHDEIPFLVDQVREELHNQANLVDRSEIGKEPLFSIDIDGLWIFFSEEQLLEWDEEGDNNILWGDNGRIYLGRYHLSVSKEQEIITEILGEYEYFPENKDGLVAGMSMRAEITHELGDDKIYFRVKQIFKNRNDSILCSSKEEAEKLLEDFKKRFNNEKEFDIEKQIKNIAEFFSACKKIQNTNK